VRWPALARRQISKATQLVATMGCVLPLAGRGVWCLGRLTSPRTELRVAEGNRLEVFALASASSRLARLEGEMWGIVERNE